MSDPPHLIKKTLEIIIIQVAIEIWIQNYWF
jgi:hypothetical protein